MMVSFVGIHDAGKAAVNPVTLRSAVLRCGANLLRRRFACAHMAGRM
jgi:hypothetical protein